MENSTIPAAATPGSTVALAHQAEAFDTPLLPHPNRRNSPNTRQASNPHTQPLCSKATMEETKVMDSAVIMTADSTIGRMRLS